MLLLSRAGLLLSAPLARAPAFVCVKQRNLVSIYHSLRQNLRLQVASLLVGQHAFRVSAVASDFPANVFSWLCSIVFQVVATSLDVSSLCGC